MWNCEWVLWWYLRQNAPNFTSYVKLWLYNHKKNFSFFGEKPFFSHCGTNFGFKLCSDDVWPDTANFISCVKLWRYNHKITVFGEKPRFFSFWYNLWVKRWNHRQCFTCSKPVCRIFYFWLVWLVNLNAGSPLLHCTYFILQSKFFSVSPNLGYTIVFV